MSPGAAEPILLTQTKSRPRLIWPGSPLKPGSGNLKHAFDFFDFPPQGYPNPEGEMHMSHESGAAEPILLTQTKSRPRLIWPGSPLKPGSGNLKHSNKP